VAEAKIDGLLRAGARVTVVSPAMTRRLAALAGQGALRHRRRRYRAGDLRGHALAVVATQDPRVTRAVAIEARSRRVWLNAADQPEACDFILPSVIRRGRLLVAVSTGGASPALARAIRLELEARLPAEYAALVEVVASVRAELRGRGAHPAREVWAHALGPGVRRLLARGERAAAADFLRRALGAA